MTPRLPIRPGQRGSGLDASSTPRAHGTVWALVICGAAGVFFGHPNPLCSFPFAVLAYPFCLHVLAAQAPTDATAFLRGWLLGLVGNSVGLYWLLIPMHDVGGLPYAPSAVSVVLLSAYLACYPAFAGLSMRYLRRFFRLPAGGSDRSAAKGGPFFAVAAALLSGAVFAGSEVLCGTVLTGFPWLSLANAFSVWPEWIQAASLVGGYGLGGCLAAAACLGAVAMLGISRSGSAIPLFSALCILAAMPVYGYIRLGQPTPQARPLSFLMVQGNIEQNTKWEPAFQKGTLRHYMDLSEKRMRELHGAVPPQKPDIVLWPETAMPFYFQAHPDYSALLHRFAIQHNTNLAFGTLGAERAPDDPYGEFLIFNRLYMLSPKGDIAGHYDKQRLVPFGEYIPFGRSLEALRNLLQGLDFTPGAAVSPIQVARPEASAPESSGEESAVVPSAPPPESAPSLGVLICYEAIFPELAQDRVENGATLLLNISNDGWFGRTSAPLQHLGHAVMRAVEQGRAIARSTNTGYTASIDARGRILERGQELFVEDTLFVSLQPSDEITVYHRLHPFPEVFLALATLFALVFGRFAAGRKQE